jgi:uncharacterized protein YggE
MNRYRLVVCSLLLALVSAAAMACQGDTVVNSSTSTAAGINVSGTGKASGTPDIVLLTLGVNVENATVAGARETAASAMQGVINSLKANGVEDRNIQTTQFTVSPQYDYSGRTQTLRGYLVSNVVTAKLTKIDTASKAIDDAATAGGNSTVIQSVQFAIDNTDRLQETAREQAIAQAKARADQLAKLAGVSLGKPIAINETYESVQPLNQVFAPRTASLDTATPIQAGELQVVVNLTVLYGIE